MSWVTEDGLHEGYAAYITNDGRAACSMSADGIAVSHGHYDTETGRWVDGEVLPWAELLGWEARCECYFSDPPDAEYITVSPPHTTVGPMWRQATTAARPGAPAPQDPEEALVGDGSGTVEEAVLRWWHEHVEASRSRLGV